MRHILSNLVDIIRKNPVSNRGQEKPGYEIVDRRLFLQLIELERFRVHRNNLQFSLVLFDVDAQQHNRELVRCIFSKIRRTDQVGWFDKCHIGVLLPGTSTSGARTVAKAISRDLCDRGQVAEDFVSFETISYPDSSLQVGAKDMSHDL